MITNTSANSKPITTKCFAISSVTAFRDVPAFLGGLLLLASLLLLTPLLLQACCLLPLRLLLTLPMFLLLLAIAVVSAIAGAPFFLKFLLLMSSPLTLMSVLLIVFSPALASFFVVDDPDVPVVSCAVVYYVVANVLPADGVPGVPLLLLPLLLMTVICISDISCSLAVAGIPAAAGAPSFVDVPSICHL